MYIQVYGLYATPWTITIHGILQARILECVAIPSPRGFSQPRDQNQVSCIVGSFFYQLSYQGSPRILEWVAYPLSRGSSWSRNQTRVSCIAGRFFISWAIRETTIQLHRFFLVYSYSKVPVWISTYFKVKVKSLSHVRLFATPWTVAHQAPLSMGFSRQEYWSGLPFSSPNLF